MWRNGPVSSSRTGPAPSTLVYQASLTARSDTVTATCVMAGMVGELVMAGSPVIAVDEANLRMAASPFLRADVGQGEGGGKARWSRCGNDQALSYQSHTASPRTDRPVPVLRCRPARHAPAERRCHRRRRRHGHRRGRSVRPAVRRHRRRLRRGSRRAWHERLWSGPRAQIGARELLDDRAHSVTFTARTARDPRGGVRSRLSLGGGRPRRRRRVGAPTPSPASPDLTPVC